tara:strand:- start:860 stop:1660 length:801 start_codon:yes stop_codon:yes gene_type:complete
MFKFRKKNIVSVLVFTGIISPNMGRRKGLNVQDFDKSIDQAFQNKNVKAVALLVNSPGGSPVQSDFLAKRIVQLSNEKNIPVISFVEDVAASGGYWLACAGNEIFASKASIIGSIGVISSGFGFNKAIEKLGIDRRVYTAGKNKSILDPFSPEKKDDIKKLKNVQNELHNYFIEYVKSRRGSKLLEENDDIFTGTFWSGEKALEIGLIDGIGEMKEILKKRFGEKVKIKEYAPKRKFFDFGNLISFAFDNIIDKVEEKLNFKKFGI